MPAEPSYEIRVRFVPAPKGHDWKGLGDILAEIGKAYTPVALPPRAAPEEEIACPS
jgi:hypothetical protein